MAANDTILVGTDWGVAGNWTGEAARVPITGDNAWISGSLKSAVTGSPDQGGVDLDLLHIDANFEQPLFSSGSPLKIAADVVEHFGAGELHYACDADGISAFKTDFVRIACRTSRVKTTLNSNPADAGEFTRILCQRGQVQILSDLVWDANGEVIINPLEATSDVHVQIDSGSDTVPALRLAGGSCESHRAITTAFIAGRMIQDDAGITTAHILPGGYLQYDATATMATCYVYPGGTLNLLGNMWDKTVTTIVAFKGSTVQYVDEILSTTDFVRPVPATPLGGDLRELLS